MPLSPQAVHILLAVADRPLHGYAIIKEVARSSRGSIRLSTGTLYGAIRRFLDTGWVREADSPVQDPVHDDDRRRYYRITAAGREAVAAETARMIELTQLARDKDLVPGGEGRR